MRGTQLRWEMPTFDLSFATSQRSNRYVLSPSPINCCTVWLSASGLAKLLQLNGYDITIASSAFISCAFQWNATTTIRWSANAVDKPINPRTSVFRQHMNLYCRNCAVLRLWMLHCGSRLGVPIKSYGEKLGKESWTGLNELKSPRSHLQGQNCWRYSPPSPIPLPPPMRRGRQRLFSVMVFQ